MQLEKVVACKTKILHISHIYSVIIIDVNNYSHRYAAPLKSHVHAPINI